MAFPTTSVLDNFNRANEDPINTNWDSTETGLKIVSNAVQVDSGVERESFWSTSNFGPNCEAYITITQKGTAGEYIYHIMLRESGTNGYFIQLRDDGSQIRFYKTVGGSTSQLGTSEGVTFNNGDKLGFQIIGTALRAFRYTGGAWSQLGTTHYDSAVTAAGRIRVVAYAGTAGTGILDDFGGGNYVESFPTTSVLDNFTGSNGSIDNRTASGGPTWDAPIWTGHTAASITSNAIVSPGSAGDYSAIISSTTYGPDCEVYATFTGLPGGPARLYARLGGAYAPPFPDTYGDGNYYELRITAGTSYALVRQMAAVATTIINGTSWSGGNLTAGDKVGFSVVEEGSDTRLRVYRTISGVWSEEADYLDTASNPTGAGYLGFELDISTTMDDFGGGTAVTGPPLDTVLPDADVTTTGWSTAPLFSKINDASDATVITATAS